MAVVRRLVIEIIDAYRPASSRLGGNFRLTIIGDGNDRSRLEEYSRELGLQDRVTWLGWKGSTVVDLLHHVKHRPWEALLSRSFQ